MNIEPKRANQVHAAVLKTTNRKTQTPASKVDEDPGAKIWFMGF